MLGALAAELTLNISEPPETGACPVTDQDNDELTLDYGSSCVPTSGLTEDFLSGSVSLTLAGGSGVFVGSLHSLGFTDLPVVGSLSGQVTRAGDLVSADIEFSEVSWTEDGLANSVDALFEVSIDGDEVLLDVASAVFVRGNPPEFRVDLEGITPAPLALGSCWVPDGGQIVLERDAATATLSYSEVAHASGEVPVAYGSRDPVTIDPCL